MDLPVVGLAVLLLASQAPPASLVGAVRDETTGDPVIGAVVSLPDLRRLTFSDSTGRYELRAVPSGRHLLAIRRLGYVTRTLHAVVPTAGDVEIDITLRREARRLPPAEIHPRVIVRGLDVDDSIAVFPARRATAAGIANDPMLAEPDPLLALEGGEIIARPELPSGVNVRGAASAETRYSIDGIPVFNPYHGAGRLSAWNADAIDAVSATSGPSDGAPAVGGVIDATTRAPNARLGVRGAVSTTHARLTADGPLGRGASYLASGRTSLPSEVAVPHESGFLRARASDAIATVALPLAGGRLRVIGAGNGDAIDIAASAGLRDTSGGRDGRNAFAWSSLSVGGTWTRAFRALRLDATAWTAMSDVDATWRAGAPTSLALASRRRDIGTSLVAARHTSRTVTTAAIRGSVMETSYDTDLASDRIGGAATDRSVALVSLSAHQQRAVAGDVLADLGITTSLYGGTLYLEPQAGVRWAPAAWIALSATADRSHAFAQSLRNTESLLGAIFPADLYLAAGGRTPVLRSDRAVVGAEVRSGSSARFGVQAFRREFSGAVLVAPRAAEPFANGDWSTGSGHATGIALDAGLTSERLAAVARYGWQRVRLDDGAVRYTPTYAPVHTVDVGVIAYATRTMSIRLGTTALFGRRGTPLSGAVEWEACSFIDRGCELAGSPEQIPAEVGTVQLPAYLRMDLSGRKTWHVRVGRRDATIAAFATVTNLFNRRNVLAAFAEPQPGTPATLEMRPLNPLVLGFDWSFD